MVRPFELVVGEDGVSEANFKDTSGHGIVENLCSWVGFTFFGFILADGSGREVRAETSFRVFLADQRGERKVGTAKDEGVVGFIGMGVFYGHL